jgi:hypothetical protein
LARWLQIWSVKVGIGATLGREMKYIQSAGDLLFILLQVVCLFLFLMIFSSCAGAQETTSAQQKDEVSKQDSSVKKSTTTANAANMMNFSKSTSIFSATTQVNNRELDDVDNELKTFISWLYIRPISKTFQLLSLVNISSEQTGEQRTQVEDSWVNLRSVLYQDSYNRFLVDTRAVFGLSENSRKRDERFGGITLIPRLDANLAPVGFTNVNIMTQLRFTQNFHRFKTDGGGDSNNEYVISAIVMPNVQINKKWSAALFARYDQAYTYRRTQVAPRFSLEESVTYQMKPNLLLTLAHNNSGQIVNNELGVDASLRVFDESSSTYYLRVDYIY